MANRPEGETSTTGGKTSRGRNVKVAKRPVTKVMDRDRGRVTDKVRVSDRDR